MRVSVVAALAFCISAGLHVGALAVLAPEGDAQLRGGGTPQAVRLGTAFKDIAERRLSASDVTRSAQPIRPEGTAPVVHARSPSAIRQDVHAAKHPPGRAKILAVRPTAIAPAERVASDHSAARAMNDGIHVSGLLKPNAISRGQISEPGLSIQSQLAQTPSSVQVSAVRPPQLSAEPDTGTVRISARPRVRPQIVESQSRPSPPPGAPASGRTERSAQPRQVAGTSDGQAKARATRTAPRKSNARQSGNAANDDHAGQVMRKIQRIRRPTGVGYGTALVSFAIGPDGALSALRIARSSGSPRLDRAALRLIERAAPFPRPPQGATRVMQIPISGK